MINIGIAAVAILGWFVNSYFNRKNEILKERRGYELKYIEQIIDLYLYIRQAPRIKGDWNVITQKLEVLLPKVYVFGTKDEVDLYRDVLSKYSALSSELNNASVYKFTSSFDYFKNTCLKRFQKSLKLEHTIDPISKDRFTDINIIGNANQVNSNE